ncbi:MAG TPA: hypothetical protein VFI40_13145 [Nocardioides sp.]|nr:hypothetical protein [Nocardioides sp.]
MRVKLLTLAAVPLLVTTGCGSHGAANKSKAAMAAEAQCQSRFDRQFHLQGTPKGVPEGFFVSDLGQGRLRVTGTVPPRAGLIHPESYTCVVVPDSSGLRIVRFDVRRTT